MTEFQQGSEQTEEQILAEAAPQAETPAPAEQQQQETPTATWNGKEWEFEANGQKYFPETREQAHQWMAQGRNYSQRMGEINKRMAEMAERDKRYEGYDRYQKVDEFARANPDWWKHVESSFNNRETYQVDPQFQNILNPLVQRLQQTEGILQEFQSEKQRQEYERQDQALDTEISEIRKAHPNIDLNSVDPASGETLELRVLKHAGQLGTTSFKAAFRDYFHDKLLDMARSQALESAAKEKAENAKKGLLGTTQAPVKGISAAQNVRAKSYDQLTQEALEELRSTGAIS